MMIVNSTFLGTVILVIRSVGLGVSFYKIMTSYVRISSRTILFTGRKVSSTISSPGYYPRLVERYPNFYLLKESLL